MPSVPKTAEVQQEIDRLSLAAGSVEDLMWEVVKVLHDRMLKYNWVGFYMLERQSTDGQPRMLVLGPFQGAMTPHTRIPLNQGICGAAASTGKTMVVDDVSLDERYLACSTETKSEIVVPIFVRGRVVGELDIDSHFPAAFGDDDRKLVEYCAALVGKQLEKSQS
jgi:L-methionine (R)-S-oxide reductase